MDPPDEVCMTLRTPPRRAASASRTVPMTLTPASNAGPSTEWRTSICAARWNTTSGRVSPSRPIRSASTMSALTNSKSGCCWALVEVRTAAGTEVVDADDGMPVCEQAVYQR